MFRRQSKPAVKSAGSLEDERFVWLSELVSAITTSLVDATRVVRDQHFNLLVELFDKSSEPESANSRPLLSPRTLRMRIPTPSASSEPSPPVEVPMAALAQANALVIDEAVIEFDCTIDRFGLPEAEGSQPRLGLRLDRGQAGSAARISLSFRRVDRPEGAARVEDALLGDLR